MAEIFISVSNGIDIDVKSGEFVINTNRDADKVRIVSSPSSVSSDGHEYASQILIKTAQPFMDELQDVISNVLDYHGVGARVQGSSIVIDDADYLSEDTIEALQVAVKGLNTYLK